MKAIYELPELESRKDNRLNIGLVWVLMGIGLIIVALLIQQGSYKRVLKECIDGGNSKEYCEMMLN